MRPPEAPDTPEAAARAAHDVARKVAAEEAERVDRDAVWPERTIRAAQAAGLGGLVVPTEHGGAGLGLEAVVRVCEELGSECASAAISLGMHYVGTAVIAAKATPTQVARYLVPIAEGRHLTTLALSEPGTGIHFYYPQSRLTRRDDGFTVDGVKSFATNGGHADSYVVSTMAADPAAPPGLFSCVVVAGDAPGISWAAPFRGFGMRGNSARSFRMRDVAIDRDALLGEEGDQIWYVFNVVAPYFLVAMAGTYLGVAQRAFDLARDHLTERAYGHTGRPLADTMVLQHRLGTMWAHVAQARAMVRWAAAEADRGGPDALPALCSAKAEIGDVAVAVTNEALTLLGGRGYAENGVATRLLRDARAAHVMAPTTDQLRVWAGRAVLGLPLLGE